MTVRPFGSVNWVYGTSSLACAQAGVASASIAAAQKVAIFIRGDSTAIAPTGESDLHLAAATRQFGGTDGSRCGFRVSPGQQDVRQRAAEIARLLRSQPVRAEIHSLEHRCRRNLHD